MRSIRIGLACEGVTDHEIFSYVFGEMFRKNEIVISFSELQPGRDATSISSEGGWRLVYQWCKKTPHILRDSLLKENGLFANTNKLDAIAIHLDGDIIDEILISRLPDDDRVDPSVYDLGNETSRLQFLIDTIQVWLGVDRHIEPNCFAAPAIECSETWVLAFFPQHENADSILDVMPHFIKRAYALTNTPLPNNISRFRKSRSRYKNILNRIPNNFDTALAQSKSLHSAYKNICDIINPPPK